MMSAKKKLLNTLGFSLIEVMVVSAIGLIVLLGMSQMIYSFVQQNTTTQVTAEYYQFFNHLSSLIINPQRCVQAFSAAPSIGTSTSADVVTNIDQIIDVNGSPIADVDTTTIGMGHHTLKTLSLLVKPSSTDYYSATLTVASERTRPNSQGLPFYSRNINLNLRIVGGVITACDAVLAGGTCDPTLGKFVKSVDYQGNVVCSDQILSNPSNPSNECPPEHYVSGVSVTTGAVICTSLHIHTGILGNGTGAPSGFPGDGDGGTVDPDGSAHDDDGDGGDGDGGDGDGDGC